MSDKLSEYIEYISKYTCWNVMAGITRSKVLYFFNPPIFGSHFSVDETPVTNQLRFVGWSSEETASADATTMDVRFVAPGTEGWDGWASELLMVRPGTSVVCWVFIFIFDLMLCTHLSIWSVFVSFEMRIICDVCAYVVRWQEAVVNFQCLLSWRKSKITWNSKTHNFDRTRTHTHIYYIYIYVYHFIL